MSVTLRVEAKNLRDRYPPEALDDLMSGLAFASYVRTGEVPSVEALAEALDLKFNSTQPRVPAGNPDGGQWTSGGSAGGTAGGENYTPLSNGPLPALLDDCTLQYTRDTAVCTRLGSTFCHDQAMRRYAACLRGEPIPPFPYR